MTDSRDCLGSLLTKMFSLELRWLSRQENLLLLQRVEFCSQNPYQATHSQLSVTTAPDLTLSLGLCARAHTHTQVCMHADVCIQINFFKNLFVPSKIFLSTVTMKIHVKSFVLAHLLVGPVALRTEDENVSSFWSPGCMLLLAWVRTH